MNLHLPPALQNLPPALLFFGDFGIGTAAEAKIPYQAYLSKQQFVLTTDDKVYLRGRVSEYLKNYFQYFNGTVSSPQPGLH